MYFKKSPLLLLCSFLLLVACSPKLNKQAVETEKQEEGTVTLDTIYISQDKDEVKEDTIPDVLPLYRAEASRTYDIVHTRLDVKFDWNKEYVYGKAYLDISAYFYPITEIVLDAVNFDIHSVNLKDASGPSLSYDYDGKKLTLKLNNALKRNETRRFYINYTAKPSEGEAGGSAAITSDRGLFFINAQGKDPNKPMQIWTQGETESNSRWFPTFDKPNERTTQEMFITIEEKYEVLSNGLRVDVTHNDDGTKTEHWVFNNGKGHAPYLFMMAIGDYAVVEDSWNGIPLQYYVEKEFKEDAVKIFNHTPEMLSFFSDILDYPYPYKKFSQVIVRDYVSGAMENTTAVVFGEFIQKHADVLVTAPNDRIVAHEMFHHWFGDLVTTESWANIVLNEGFANYGEYLWSEYKYGLDDAQMALNRNFKGYLRAASRSPRPTVYYKYRHRMSMFDAQTYNKGGLILNMLRHYLGDELFFSTLNYYLNEYKYTATEIADLRLAFEKMSGQDLHWFFNQWFHTAGHPILNISENYNVDSSTVSVTVEQTQDPEKSKAIFKLPTTIAIYYSASDVEKHSIVIDERKQTFTFPVKQEPALVVLDPADVLLAVKHEDYTAEELALLAEASPSTPTRIEAFEALAFKDIDAMRNLRKLFLKDDSWYIRRAAIRSMDYTDQNAPVLKKYAAHDERTEVRLAALNKLDNSGDSTLISMYEAKIDTAYALAEQLKALEGLYKLNSEKALKLSEQYRSRNGSLVNNTLASIYGSEKDPKYLPFFKKQIKAASGYSLMGIMGDYAGLVAQTDVTGVIENIDFLKGIFNRKGNSFFTQVFLANGVSSIGNMVAASEDFSAEEKARISKHIKAVMQSFYESTDNDRLKAMLQRFQ